MDGTKSGRNVVDVHRIIGVAALGTHKDESDTSFQIISCSFSQCLQDRRYEDFQSGSACPSLCSHNHTVSPPRDLRFHNLMSCFTGVCIDAGERKHLATVGCEYGCAKLYFQGKFRSFQKKPDAKMKLNNQIIWVYIWELYDTKAPMEKTIQITVCVQCNSK